MMLPMLGWAVTGLVFHIKPGYAGAYETLSVKTYPLAQTIAIQSDKNWQEVRMLRTVLGDHLLVLTEAGARHLHPATRKPMPLPGPAQLQQLFEDAVSGDIERYGSILAVNGDTAETTTGVRVVLDWETLRLTQRGTDTALIDLLYEIHYLRWTPWESINRVLSSAGLLLLFALSLLGLRVYLAGNGTPLRESQREDTIGKP